MAADPPADPATDLCARWREEAARWNRMAAAAREQPHPDRAMAQRCEYRAEVYEICADDLERSLADPSQGAQAEPDPGHREINCTAATTQVRPNYDQGTRTQRPVGFGIPA